MDSAYLDTVVEHLTRYGSVLGPGLHDSELDAIERRCGFHFPVDLRALLNRFEVIGWCGGGDILMTDWRNTPEDLIQQSFEMIFNGIQFDIEHGFWRPAWGQRPSVVADAVLVARRALEKAPPLITVVGHGQMPFEPTDAGNPFFSVNQTDIIVVSNDLPHSFARYGIPLPPWATELLKDVPVWTESVDWHDAEYWVHEKVEGEWRIRTRLIDT